MEPQQRPDRNLAMELMRATEAAALAGGRWMGRGDKNAADGAAVEAMRVVLSTRRDGRHRRDRRGRKGRTRPCCSTASRSATARRPTMDIAVDPIDGTTLTSLGRPGAIAVIALSERGTMFNPGPCVYMEKIAAGPARRRGHRPQRTGEGQPRGRRQGARRTGERRHRGDPRPRPSRPTSSASAARPVPGSG